MFFLFFDPDASKVASKVGKGQVGQKKGGGDSADNIRGLRIYVVSI